MIRVQNMTQKTLLLGNICYLAPGITEISDVMADMIGSDELVKNGRVVFLDKPYPMELKTEAPSSFFEGI